MRAMTLRNSRVLSEENPPYVVAEVNTSHSGNMDAAKGMIAKAKEVGCDCVKFQSWTPETLYSTSFYDNNPVSRRIFQKFSFSDRELSEAAVFCQQADIGFSSTPYSRAEVDFLAYRSNAPFIKVASMDLNNYAYLDYIARTGVPMVLSTGMGDMDEMNPERPDIDVIASLDDSNFGAAALGRFGQFTPEDGGGEFRAVNRAFQPRP